MRKIVKLNSFICEKVWGGTKLFALKNLKNSELNANQAIGETWEVSTHKDGSSLIDQVPLSSICSLSYIVKFIDTSDNLSIQVHPGDEYAKQHEKSKGKSECWIILDSEENAGIYLGFKEGITKKEFFTALEAKLPMENFLNFIPVNKGDFYFLPPGSVHAIGKGVTLCEVQQSSGITYRVWDWDRMGMDAKPRELHIEKAKDVLNFNHNFNLDLLRNKKEKLLDISEITPLATHEDFKVQLFSNFNRPCLQLNLKAKDSIIVLSGEISGDIELDNMQSAFVLEQGCFDFKIKKHTSFIVVSE